MSPHGGGTGDDYGHLGKRRPKPKGQAVDAEWSAYLARKPMPYGRVTRPIQASNDAEAIDILLQNADGPQKPLDGWKPLP